ncbi:hypothetical protein ACIBH1_26085 [Nonomuraea sp. NPDC050663]|uniref:iron-sulfur cluster-binding protein n=1 Tax=Nonomuraea sp. NPDC050663 TaxID=3364370 RepID=UPI00379B77A2
MITTGFMDVLPASEEAQPTWIDAPVLSNVHLADRYHRLRLAAPLAAERARPGQFVMLTLSSPALALPRPMAVHDADPETGTIDIVYGVVGIGTREMAALEPGATVGTLGPLGRPFAPPATPGRALLLSRGIGICSLSLLGRELHAAGWEVLVVASGRTPQAVVGTEELEEAGVPVLRVDDESGTSDPEHLRNLDFVPTYVTACGSARLEQLAADHAHTAEVQIALEAPMACGLGYCHGCSTGARTAQAEAPLVCADGPVFRYRPAPR